MTTYVEDFDFTGMEASPEPSKSIVTQELLSRFLEAATKKAEATRAYEAARLELLRLHHADAQVEPGALKLSVKMRQLRVLSRHSISAAFGTEEYERLIAGVAPSVSEQVSVRQASGRRRRSF